MTNRYSSRSIVPGGLKGTSVASDPDVTPVLNMFIILIPFLISMSAFSHLAVHEFNLPGDDGPSQAVTRDQLPYTVVIGLAGMAVVQGDLVVKELPAHDGLQDTSGLLTVLKQLNPDQVVVSVQPDVSTADLVRCLDTLSLAGCEDVGLAAGVATSDGKGGNP